MMKTWKPGEKAPRSGTYVLMNADGSKTRRQITVRANDTFPPADKDGQTYMPI